MEQDVASRYRSFSVFGPWGLTPGPKFTNRGEDLADSEIYQIAKFHRYGQTNKQTVNDISTTCLSACVDNKQQTICPQHAYRHIILPIGSFLGMVDHGWYVVSRFGALGLRG